MGVTLLRRSHLASASPTAASCHGSGLRGWTGELRKLWDEDILYKTRFKGEATVVDVRVAEGVVVAKWVPTYTGGDPRETRFEVLELFCLEKLESGGRRS